MYNVSSLPNSLTSVVWFFLVFQLNKYINLSQTYKFSVFLQYEDHESHEKRVLECVFYVVVVVEKNDSKL